MSELLIPLPSPSPLPWLEARHVTHCFRARQGWLGLVRPWDVLQDINLTVRRGQVMGLVGESGCGKTTLARLMLGLIAPTHGVIRYAGEAMPGLREPRWRALRRRMQMVFQDPYASLDKRMTLLDQVAEPLLAHRLANREQAREQARETLRLVGMPAHSLNLLPASLSGGQLQRAVIARAVVMGPDVLVCDEPTASLDVSIQAQVLALLDDLRAQTGMTMLFVSHNLNVVRYVSDEVTIMYLGRVVETGPVDQIFSRPAHPYTELLLASAPGSGRSSASADRDQGLPSPIDRPGGCGFHPRCVYGDELCQTSRPDLEPVFAASGHSRQTACFHPLEGDRPCS